VGQEAVPAALGLLVGAKDLAVSTHRSHAHYLGKGGDLNRMIAEIYGKATGCARGKGGSMHLLDIEQGFMGSTAIVGNSIPLGVGLALSMQLQGQKQVAIVFLGDGAIEEGAFYESANFAAVRRLPVLFVCENNLYSVYSSLKPRQPQGRRIHELVEAIGVPSELGDGNDVMDCADRFSRILARMRLEPEPYFIELPTYRWREHCGANFDNHIGYRTEREFLEWKDKDPIVLFRTRALREGLLEERDLVAEELKVKQEVEEAFAFAESSPWPEGGEAFSDLFATQRELK
jgi:pyruvate dehydrogenase E1 component alpha subunit